MFLGLQRTFLRIQLHPRLQKVRSLWRLTCVPYYEARFSTPSLDIFSAPSKPEVKPEPPKPVSIGPSQSPKKAWSKPIDASKSEQAKPAMTPKAVDQKPKATTPVKPVEVPSKPLETPKASTPLKNNTGATIAPVAPAAKDDGADSSLLSPTYC